MVRPLQYACCGQACGRVRWQLYDSAVTLDGAGRPQDKYDPASDHIVTAASCTTNCLAPVVRVVHEKLGIARGCITTIHNLTNTQTIVDAPNAKKADLRRARWGRGPAGPVGFLVRGSACKHCNQTACRSVVSALCLLATELRLLLPHAAGRDTPSQQPLHPPRVPLWPVALPVPVSSPVRPIGTGHVRIPLCTNNHPSALPPYTSSGAHVRQPKPPDAMQEDCVT